MTSSLNERILKGIRAFDHGCSAILSSRHAEAERHCSRALSVLPHWHDALQRRALARTELGKFKGALADYQKALLSFPQCHWCWGDLADTYSAAKNPTRAKECLDMALCFASRSEPDPEIRQEQAQYHLDRGLVLLALEQPRAALRDFNAARRDRGLRYLATLGRARALALSGQITQALRDLNACVRMLPEDEDCYFFRAIVRLLNNDRSGGLKDAQRVKKKALKKPLLMLANSKALPRLASKILERS